ncbi:MAG: hypothetical protein PHD07_04690 [Bacteroidales bacterium]|nr:hypothetical protein [Bacteroidales bacterium]MDD3201660.1 hypothetical protein [Bacteroidales bacterium]
MRKICFLILITVPLLSCYAARQDPTKYNIDQLIADYNFKKAIVQIDSLLLSYRDTTAIVQDLTAVMQEKEWVLKKSGCLKKLYRYNEAIDVLSEWNGRYAEITDNVDWKVTTELAECYALMGDYETALSSYYFLSTAAPSNTYYSLQILSLLYRMEQYPAAISQAKSILTGDSTHISTLSYLANSFNKFGIADSAVVYYDKMLVINPFDVETINKKSNILLSQKRENEVIALTNDYLSQDSTNLTINAINGIALHLKNAYNESNAVFMRMLRLGDESYSTNYYIGLNYFFLNKEFQAEPYFAEAYSQDSSDVNLVYYYASSKSWQKYRFNEAKRLYDKALHMLAPDSAMMFKVYYGYASGCYRTNDYKSALEYYKLCLNYNPSYYAVYSSMGYCYEMLNDLETSVLYYEKYLKFAKPGSKNYKAAKERLEDLKGELFMRQK